jgi:PcfJ-like protein
MTSFDWTTAIAESCTHLAGLGNLPPPSLQHPGLQAIAVVSLIAATPIKHALAPASTIPVLTIARYSGCHELVDNLLAELAQAASEPARGNFHKAFSASNWLSNNGLHEIVLRSVEYTPHDNGRATLLAHTASRANALMDQQHQLRDLHMRRLLERDLPQLHPWRDWQASDPSLLAWLLAHEFDGDQTRAIRIHRRHQALRLYGGISTTLREPAATKAIDAGHKLVPLLMERLTLTGAQLRALREATPPESFASYRHRSFEHAVLHLQAHAVPLHQWPGGGQPGKHAAWTTSPWLTTDEFTLIPADYFGSDSVTVRDALQAFADDLLKPLIAELVQPARPLADVLDVLVHNNLPAARRYLATVRRALIGPRGPKAFQEAVRIWHRRAAAVAALRNENQTDRPGWPALCPPWTSPCGHYHIVPLTTAKALVDEGNTHGHCVGTYYDSCRRGDTQILSLREDGKPAVTAEILLDPRIATLRVGQFKGLCDQVPDNPSLHQAMRNFLRALRTGAHPLNRAELRAYRRWADTQYFAWAHKPLSIAHAREAFPLYLPLLPRGTPSSFDLWCDQTGIKTGLTEALNHAQPLR